MARPPKYFELFRETDLEPFYKARDLIAEQLTVALNDEFAGLVVAPTESISSQQLLVNLLAFLRAAFAIGVVSGLNVSDFSATADAWFHRLGSIQRVRQAAAMGPLDVPIRSFDLVTYDETEWPPALAAALSRTRYRELQYIVVEQLFDDEKVDVCNCMCGLIPNYVASVPDPSSHLRAQSQSAPSAGAEMWRTRTGAFRSELDALLSELRNGKHYFRIAPRSPMYDVAKDDVGLCAMEDRVHENGLVFFLKDVLDWRGHRGPISKVIVESVGPWS